MNTYTISLYLMLCGGLFGLAWSAGRRHRRWCKNRAAIAYCWCAAMLKLLKSMQMHRGMANTYLSGDKTFERRMLACRSDIESLLQHIATLPGQPQRKVAGFDEIDVTAWVQEWHDLSSRLTDCSAVESLRRHTALIANLLAWLRGMGESGLTLTAEGARPQALHSIALFCERLPALAETLGCARALGAGAAASGAVTAVARTRLRYLAARIDALKLAVNPATQDTLAIEPHLQQSMHEMDNKVGVFLDTLQNDVIACEKSRVSAGSYFASATTAIESVFALAELLGEQLASPIVRSNTSQPNQQRDKARTAQNEKPSRYPADLGLATQKG